MKENNNNSVLKTAESTEISNAQWTAMIRINNEIQNPEWAIKNSEANKFQKLMKMLPFYQGIIPNIALENNRCEIRNTQGIKIVCYNGFVVSYNSGLIVIKSDSDYTLENEILKSMPENVYKEVFRFL